MSDSTLIYVIGQMVPALFYLATFALHFLYGKLPPAIQPAVKAVAETVVPAIEQNASLLSNAAKKQEAVRLVGKILNSIGIQAHPDLIDAAIEAAVYALPATSTTAVTQKIPVQK